MLRCLILFDCPTPWNGNSQSVSNEPRRYQRKLAFERSEAAVHNVDAGQQTDNRYSSESTPSTRTTAQDDSDKHSLNWSKGRSQIAIESMYACNKLKTVTYIITYSTTLGSGRTNQVINLSLLRNTQTTSYIRGRIHGLGWETIILTKWQTSWAQFKRTHHRRQLRPSHYTPLKNIALHTPHLTATPSHGAEPAGHCRPRDDLDPWLGSAGE